MQKQTNRENGKHRNGKKNVRIFATKENNAIRQILDEKIKWNQMKGFPGGGQHIEAGAIFEKVFGELRQKWTNWKKEFVSS